MKDLAGRPRLREFCLEAGGVAFGVDVTGLFFASTDFDTTDSSSSSDSSGRKAVSSCYGEEELCRVQQQQAKNSFPTFTHGSLSAGGFPRGGRANRRRRCRSTRCLAFCLKELNKVERVSLNLE